MSTIDFNDPATKQQWVNVFLQGCFQQFQILEQAAVAVTPQELSQVMGASVAQVILYQAVVSHYQEFKALAAPQALAITVHKLTGQLVAFSPAQKAAVVNEMTAIFSGAMAQPMAMEYAQPVLALVKHIHNKARIEPQLQQILSEGQLGQSVEEVLGKVMALKKDAKTAKVSSNPWDLSRKRNMGDLFSSGLAWLDGLIGGGFRTGEAYGILAETGGGKTSLSANLTCALAAQGKKVMIVVTEQSFDEITLRAKYWAVITKRSWEEFVKYEDPSMIPAELVSTETKALVSKLTSVVKAYDISQVTNMADLQEVVQQHKPDVFILDWAGTMANKILEDPKNVYHGDRVQCLRAIADQVNAIAKSVGNVGVVFHQLAPGVGRNAFRDYDHTMAAECKSFCFNLSFGIVLSPRDKRDVMKIACTKSRLGGKKDCIVKLNGPLSTFEPMNGYKKSTKGYWDKPSAASEQGDLPDQKKGDLE